MDNNLHTGIIGEIDRSIKNPKMFYMSGDCENYIVETYKWRKLVDITPREFFILILFVWVAGLVIGSQIF